MVSDNNDKTAILQSQGTALAPPPASTSIQELLQQAGKRRRDAASTTGLDAPYFDELLGKPIDILVDIASWIEEVRKSSDKDAILQQVIEALKDEVLPKLHAWVFEESRHTEKGRDKGLTMLLDYEVLFDQLLQEKHFLSRAHDEAVASAIESLSQFILELTEQCVKVETTRFAILQKHVLPTLIRCMSHCIRSLHLNHKSGKLSSHEEKACCKAILMAMALTCPVEGLHPAHICPLLEPSHMQDAFSPPLHPLVATCSHDIQQPATRRKSKEPTLINASEKRLQIPPIASSPILRRAAIHLLHTVHRYVCSTIPSNNQDTLELQPESLSSESAEIHSILQHMSSWIGTHVVSAHARAFFYGRQVSSSNSPTTPDIQTHRAYGSTKTNPNIAFTTTTTTKPQPNPETEDTHSRHNDNKLPPWKQNPCRSVASLLLFSNLYFMPQLESDDKLDEPVAFHDILPVVYSLLDDDSGHDVLSCLGGALLLHVLTKSNINDTKNDIVNTYTQQDSSKHAPDKSNAYKNIFSSNPEASLFTKPITVTHAMAQILQKHIPTMERLFTNILRSTHENNALLVFIVANCWSHILTVQQWVPSGKRKSVFGIRQQRACADMLLYLHKHNARACTSIDATTPPPSSSSTTSTAAKNRDEYRRRNLALRLGLLVGGIHPLLLHLYSNLRHTQGPTTVALIRPALVAMLPMLAGEVYEGGLVPSAMIPQIRHKYKNNEENQGLDHAELDGMVWVSTCLIYTCMGAWPVLARHGGKLMAALVTCLGHLDKWAIATSVDPADEVVNQVREFIVQAAAVTLILCDGNERSKARGNAEQVLGVVEQECVEALVDRVKDIRTAAQELRRLRGSATRSLEGQGVADTHETG